MCLFVSDTVRACEDLDTDGCNKLLHENAALCDEEVFAYSACARSCGKCRKSILETNPESR